jgi:hypothetical protein
MYTEIPNDRTAHILGGFVLKYRCHPKCDSVAKGRDMVSIC